MGRWSLLLIRACPARAAAGRWPLQRARPPGVVTNQLRMQLNAEMSVREAASHLSWVRVVLGQGALMVLPPSLAMSAPMVAQMISDSVLLSAEAVVLEAVGGVNADVLADLAWYGGCAAAVACLWMLLCRLLCVHFEYTPNDNLSVWSLEYCHIEDAESVVPLWVSSGRGVFVGAKARIQRGWCLYWDSWLRMPFWIRMNGGGGGGSGGGSGGGGSISGGSGGGGGGSAGSGGCGDIQIAYLKPWLWLASRRMFSELRVSHTSPFVGVTLYLASVSRANMLQTFRSALGTSRGEVNLSMRRGSANYRLYVGVRLSLREAQRAYFLSHFFHGRREYLWSRLDKVLDAIEKQRVTNMITEITRCSAQNIGAIFSSDVDVNDAAFDEARRVAARSTNKEELSLMMHGEPGNGKTYFSLCCAVLATMDLNVVSVGDWKSVESAESSLGSSVRGRSVVLLDELDRELRRLPERQDSVIFLGSAAPQDAGAAPGAVTAPRRAGGGGGGGDGMTRMDAVALLLREFGSLATPGSIVVATTNDLTYFGDNKDMKGLLRAGRFEPFHVGKPDLAVAAQIAETRLPLERAAEVPARAKLLLELSEKECKETDTDLCVTTMLRVARTSVW